MRMGGCPEWRGLTKGPSHAKLFEDKYAGSSIRTRGFGGVPSTTSDYRQACNVFDKAAVQPLWDAWARDGFSVDVLVWNAVAQPAMLPVLEQGADRLWEDFEKDVRAPVSFVERFDKQPGHEKQKVCLELPLSCLEPFKRRHA